VPEEKNLNNAINVAFLAISRRAESVDRETLVQTFVDIGPLIAVLSSRDHQIVYGRRGTGKTHALLYVAEVSKKEGTIPIYVDLRYIGSSGGLYADLNVPLPQRATRLLMDVLGTIHENLFSYAIENNLDLSAVGPALDLLANAATEIEVVGEMQRESRHQRAQEAQNSSDITAFA
jgi:hypothetical protein